MRRPAKLQLVVDLRDREHSVAQLKHGTGSERREFRAAESLILMVIEDLLRSVGGPSAVAEIVFVRGPAYRTGRPGSFMNLRHAASLINAWALVHRIRVVDEQGRRLKLPIVPRYGRKPIVSQPDL